jgi:hypothetical protein
VNDNADRAHAERGPRGVVPPVGLLTATTLSADTALSELAVKECSP